jgi:two-component system OmpR family sensor kinase
MIDPDAFAILLRNLIENALKHGAADQAIEISLERIASTAAVLKVVNAGLVVPAPLLAQLTGRFMRGASSADGSGLGLAIATAITKGVGATLTLNSPAPGRDDGFEALVRFTATDPA